jgi:hypothetical protein
MRRVSDASRDRRPQYRYGDVRGIVIVGGDYGGRGSGGRAASRDSAIYS